jgi:hypothetical protein
VGSLGVLVEVEQSLRVLLVDGLAGHAQRLGDERPRPSVAQRALDLGVLEAVGEATEGDDGGESVGGVGGVGGVGDGHGWLLRNRS